MTQDRRNKLKEFLDWLESTDRVKEHKETLQVEKTGDYGDDAMKISNTDLASAQLAARKTRILQVKEALRSDLDGKDLCVECGMPIGGARIEAIPWAVRCVRCEEEFEEKERAKGEPRRLRNQKDYGYANESNLKAISKAQKTTRLDI